MSDRTRNNHRIGRLLLEGIVVIVSILIAFGLDAWWDRSVERRDFVDDLANVELELATNIAAVAAAVEFQARAMASIDVLLDHAAATPVGAPMSVPDTVILQAFVSTPSYDPSTGAIDALIASGRLSDLDDAELKSILTDFRTAVLDIREDELGARSAAHDRVLPLFWDSPAIASAFAKVNEIYDEGFGRVPMASQTVDLPHVDGLSNRLHFRRAWVIAAVRELEIHEARLKRAAELMSQQLRDR